MQNKHACAFKFLQGQLGESKNVELAEKESQEA